MIEYDINEDFKKDVLRVLENKSYVEFNPIREQELVIHCLVATKTNAQEEEQEMEPPVTCKKIPADYKVITGGHYVLRICNYFRNHASETQIEAAIHRALMSIQVDKNEETGKITLKKRKPDVVEYAATVNRYGAYTDTLLDFRDVLKASARQLVETHKPKELKNSN